MLPPRIRNKFSSHPRKTMRPISMKLSEEMISMLEETATEHGFKRIQELLRLYIRQGLDRDNKNYNLAQDDVFIDKLRAKGVSLEVIKQAVQDTHDTCSNSLLPKEQMGK